MKTFKNALALLGALAITSSAMAATTQSTNFTVNIALPDNNLAGIASTRVFATSLTNILDLNVTLNIQGDFNGDLTGYISHGTNIAVLLNRTGKTADNPFGYSDAGFNVKLDDQAANDIHSYHLAIGSALSLGGQLTGTWQPDGRYVSPSTVTDADARLAMLSQFNGADPSGDWTLFLADVSPGGSSTLINWGLEITGVPEPSTTLMFALGGFGLLFAWRGFLKRA